MFIILPHKIYNFTRVSIFISITKIIHYSLAALQTVMRLAILNEGIIIHDISFLEMFIPP